MIGDLALQNKDNPFRNFKFRTLIVAELLLFIVYFLGVGILYLTGRKLDEGLLIETLAVCTYLVIVIFVYRGIKKYQINPGRWFGPIKSNKNFKSDFVCYLTTLAASIFSVYLIFYPLSFWTPGFVEFWLLDNDLFYTSTKYTNFPLLCNAMVLFLLLIAAPVMEELLFRGFLLHRFTTKWNVQSGVMVSSLIFGLLHSDILGSFIFSILMCVIYMRTRSIWWPIIFHGINNLIVVALFGLEYGLTGQIFALSMADFYADAWVGWVSGFIFLASLPYLYRQGFKGLTNLVPPYFNIS